MPDWIDSIPLWLVLAAYAGAWVAYWRLFKRPLTGQKEEDGTHTVS